MDIQPVNLAPRIKKRARRWWRRKSAPIFILLGLLLGLFLFANSTSPSGFNFLNPGPTLEEEDGRVNVLLLGTPGRGHDGPNLTDTVIVASYDTKTQNLELISLPRDLWVDKHKVKVNALYQLGINQDGGIDFVEEEVGQILGMKIPYGVRVDFNGFIKAVDLVGELDVEVQKSFDDFSYPVPGKERELCDLVEKEVELNEEQAKPHGVPPGKIKALVDKEDKIATVATSAKGDFEFIDQQVFKLFPCRFEHLEFKAGLTHMNGETALKFVRSRHGTGSEGSDFARSKRQQLVLQAFKDKILSLGTLTDPQKLVGLLETFQENVEIDIPIKNFVHFVDIAKKIKTTHNFVLEPGGKDPLLVVPPYSEYGGAFVLIPPQNDFTRIHNLVDQILIGNYEATRGAVLERKE